MNDKKHLFSVSDFLYNDKFITWRLFRTNELDEYWKEFLENNPDSKLLLDEACKRFSFIKLSDKNLKSEKEKELFERIYSNINRRRKRKYLKYWSSVAASVVILLSIALFNKYYNEEELVAETEITGFRLPEKCMKLFFDEEVVFLESNCEITLSDQGEATMTYNNSEVKKTVSINNKINKLVVPFGQRSVITLSDGSKVWINSGTELEFPSSFTGNTREIRVNGEIFLDVHKSNQPFIVHTHNSRVDVLGTQFNISAYKDDSEERVVLVEGSLKVSAGDASSMVIAPNEMVSIFDNEITKMYVDVSEHISWRHGVMTFKRTPMTEVLKSIGRYYNVSFIMNDNISISEKTVSGKLLLYDDLDSVMSAFSYLSSTDYKRENEQIVFLRKK